MEIKRVSRGKWTIAEERSVIADYRNHMSYELIAERHNRSKSAIKARVTKLGLAREMVDEAMFSAEMDARLIEMWQSNDYVIADIALELDVRYEHARYRAHDLGLHEKAAISSYRKRMNAQPKIEITEWPEDMPRFEDHKNTITGRGGGQYVRGER